MVQERVTKLWKMLAQLDGLDRKAQAVAKHFKTPREMVLAGLSIKLKREVEEYFERNPKAAVKEWMEVDGVGKKTAMEAVRVMGEEE